MMSASIIKIPLTKGMFATVDLADVHILEPFGFTGWWVHTRHNKETSLHYARKNADKKSGRKLRMHRVIINAPPGIFVDHINGDGLDNRRCNLRLVTAAQNLWNARKIAGGSSLYKGVSWSASSKKWRVTISRNGSRLYIGSFLSEKEAAIAYDKYAFKFHGKYARFNFPELINEYVDGALPEDEVDFAL